MPAAFIVFLILNVLLINAYAISLLVAYVF
jgi:hypothetical protein